MKTIPAALHVWLDQQTRDSNCWRADLITISCTNGQTFYWTTADRDLVWSGHTFSSAAGGNAPIVVRGGYKQSCRLSIDTIDLTLSGPFLIDGKSLVYQCLQGLFDGARVNIDHCIGPVPGTLYFNPISSWFEGPVANADPVGSALKLRCKSQLVLMNQKLPKVLLTPQCQNNLYDSNCTVSKASWVGHGLNAAGGGNLNSVAVGIESPEIIAHPSDYWNLGVMTWTSGPLTGIRRMIDKYQGGYSKSLNWTIPLPFPPLNNSTETYVVQRGCDRTHETCELVFGNLAHFRGYVFIPSPEAGA